MKPDISVIVPVLYEEERINSVVDHVRGLADKSCIEIIVADGDPRGSTARAVTDKDVKTLVSARGRAVQMNAGAAQARGHVLLFLHADTLLPSGAFREIIRVTSSEKFEGGAFSPGFDDGYWWIRASAFMARHRTRLSRVPFGDQGIFLKRDYFRKIGGYADIPLMEDIELMRRIKKSGGRIYISENNVVTSARKWRQDGIYFTTFRNWTLQLLYLAGVNPERLVKYYYR